MAARQSPWFGGMMHIVIYVLDRWLFKTEPGLQIYYLTKIYKKLNLVVYGKIIKDIEMSKKKLIFTIQQTNILQYVHVKWQK